MAKKDKPIPTGKVSDYRIVDKKRGIYEHKTKPEIQINRNSLEQLRAREIGYENRQDMQRSRRSNQYKRWFHASLSDKVKGPNSRADFEKLYIAARKDDFNDLSPNGSLARLLVAQGMRDPDADYNVGSTPKKK